MRLCLRPFSWVMARGQAGMAWVTVQTHMNVVAVASLHEMACVIMPDSIRMEEALLNKAVEEGISVLSSPSQPMRSAGGCMRGLPQPQA